MKLYLKMNHHNKTHSQIKNTHNRIKLLEISKYLGIKCYFQLKKTNKNRKKIEKKFCHNILVHSEWWLAIINSIIDSECHSEMPIKYQNIDQCIRCKTLHIISLTHTHLKSKWSQRQKSIKIEFVADIFDIEKFQNRFNSRIFSPFELACNLMIWLSSIFTISSNLSSWNKKNVKTSTKKILFK